MIPEKMTSSNAYLLAVSKSAYRGIMIWETGDGFTIFISGKQYDFVSYPECMAFVDACISNIVN